MALVSINKDPSRSSLRLFGLLLGLFFLLLGAMRWRHHPTHTVSYVLWGLGAALAIAYFLLPAIQKPIYVGLSYATYPIGWVVSHVVLAVTFFGVLTPIAFVMRLMGRDAMQRRFEPQAASYWTNHDPSADVARYFRQY